MDKQPRDAGTGGQKNGDYRQHFSVIAPGIVVINRHSMNYSSLMSAGTNCSGFHEAFSLPLTEQKVLPACICNRLYWSTLQTI